VVNRFRSTSLRWLLGFLVVPMAAYATVQVIAVAWAACDDAEPPYLFGLLFLIMPAIGLVMAVSWTITVLLTYRLRAAIAVPLACALVASVGLAGFVVNVPAHDPGFYPAHDADFPDCSSGRPSWWPEPLPL
jgi:hypothetical protein